MRVALIHYWLVNMRGGEKVLEALAELFPQADIYTHVCDPANLSPALARRNIRTTFIGRLPLARRLYQRYLPLMPMALEQIDLRGYDLVISSESGPAKGVITDPGTLHVCYCHTPMRYLWNMYHDYRRSAGPLTRLLMGPTLHRMRQWDLASAHRVDHFIANSTTVARRIRKYYGREAEVIHPPVAVEDFTPAQENPDDFYLCCGQLVPYKRIDLAVEAFNRMGKRLVVIGEGPELRRLRRIAGPTVEFLGRQPFEVIRDHYARCRAFVFPGEEDFGITPVEAMASGRPVIAYDRGGVRDSVLEGQTGLFFDEQTPEALIDAVQRFESQPEHFPPSVAAARARQFDRDQFKTRIRQTIEREMEALKEAEAQPHPSPAPVVEAARGWVNQ